jgi:cell wall-associated NlpC family hydrolase
VGGRIGDLLADRDGVWLATDRGVRRLVPGIPDAVRGYDGYVRVRLGPPESAPASDRDQRLADEVAGWLGVPYRYGGNDKSGVDCSGFVCAVCRTCGVELPRTSEEIAHAGRKVVDELRYGDILCFPGHVALYIGNGMTAEAQGTRTEPGAVANASIWNRTPTTIRRVLR